MNEERPRAPVERDVGLLPCPCGEVPTELIVTSHEGDWPKWAMASGNCCSDWHVEFRNDWKQIGSPECADRAARAWNKAARANTGLSGRGAANPGTDAG